MKRSDSSSSATCEPRRAGRSFRRNCDRDQPRFISCKMNSATTRTSDGSGMAREGGLFFFYFFFGSRVSEYFGCSKVGYPPVRGRLKYRDFYRISSPSTAAEFNESQSSYATRGFATSFVIYRIHYLSLLI